MSHDKEEIKKLEEEIEKLKKEIEETKNQSKEHLDGWKRAKADYINREREIEKDKSIWMEFVTLDLLFKFLPIAESLEAAIKHKDKNEDFLKGIEQIKKQFDSLFQSMGIERIKTVGEKFNPEFHEVVGKTGEGEEITEEVSAGYKMGGKIIKVAKIIIK